MNTIFYQYFYLSKPYFKNRQEMFDLLEHNFEYIAENHKLLNMMKIEVLEAKMKIASEIIKNKKKALKEYEKASTVLKWLNEAEMYFNPRFRSRSCAEYKGSYLYIHPLGYFADYRYTHIGTRFDKFEYKMEQMEQEEQNSCSRQDSRTLNDEFKMLELQPKIDQALADLKAKMGL